MTLSTHLSRLVLFISLIAIAAQTALSFLPPIATPATSGSQDYFPLIFSGAPTARVISDISSIVHQKANVSATWILNCEDLTSINPAIRQTVKKLQKDYQDAVGYFLRSGMGLASGGGVPVATTAQVFKTLDTCFALFKKYFGTYPILAMWISDISILKHIQAKFGSQIAISADWQSYKTDTISSSGSFDYPFYPSLNHALVPGQNQQVDILNYEAQHPDLYWSKVGLNRPGFEPISSQTLAQMQLLTNSVYKESSFNQDQIKVLPAIIELGYTYAPPSGSIDPSKPSPVTVLKGWLNWLYATYPQIHYTNLSQFNQAFRQQQAHNTSSYALLQSGSEGAKSGLIYPARGSEYKTFIYWSSTYRARLDVKVGPQGYIRLSDFTPYTDMYHQEKSPQDISIYQGMNQLELANIGLKENWQFNTKTVSINDPTLNQLADTITLDSIHKEGNNYLLSFKIATKDTVIAKQITFSADGITYTYNFDHLQPQSVSYETFKATYNLQTLSLNHTQILPAGHYIPNQYLIRQIIARDFYLSDSQTLGTVSQVDIVQGENTPLDWQSSTHPDDSFVPTNASSVTKTITNPHNGTLTLSLKPIQPTSQYSQINQWWTTITSH